MNFHIKQDFFFSFIKNYYVPEVFGESGVPAGESVGEAAVTHDCVQVRIRLLVWSLYHSSSYCMIMEINFDISILTIAAAKWRSLDIAGTRQRKSLSLIDVNSK